MSIEVLFWEILRGIEVTAGWQVLFCLCSRPKSRAHHLLMLLGFIAGYTFWYLVPVNDMFAPGTAAGRIINADVVNALLWGVIVIGFAFISGDTRNALIAAMYYIGIEQCFDVLRVFINRTINGRYVPNYWQYNIQYLAVLGWTYFYYIIIRRHRGVMPLQTLIITLLMPAGSFLILTYYADVSRAPAGTDAWLRMQVCGIVLGLFLTVLNVLEFYLYVKLLVSRDAKAFAMEVGKAQPVWSPGKGVSAEFIEKYNISKREKAVIEALLEYKTYRAVSDRLFISRKTVETHLRNIYQKTGAGNRFALYTLIKG